MKKLSFFVLSFFLVFTSFAFSADLEVVRVDRRDVPDFVGYVPNEIVVKFSPSITTKMDKAKAPKGLMGIPLLDQAGVRYKTKSILPQFPKAKKKIYRGKTVDLSGWHKIKFLEKVDVKNVVKEYKKIPGVIDAQPIGIHTISSTPNDPQFYINDDWSQWYLNQANDVDIDAPEAWDIETGSEDIIVAILDTGVRYFHKDLGGASASYTSPELANGNMWINSDEKYGDAGSDDDGNGFIDDWVGYDFVHGASVTNFEGLNFTCLAGEDCENQDNDPRDFNGHGTHVAGIVAAITNNGYGTASTAGGWGNDSLQEAGDGVKIMPLRICWSADNWLYGELGLCRMDFAAEAFYYAADNGAKFVNASWGSDSTGSIPEAIDYFLASGGIIFKSAGNGNSQSADYINDRTDTGIVSVAATDSDDCKANFSSYGNWVDISAPGVGILSSYHMHDSPETDYVAFMDGTSMASPLALSVAALIWSQNLTWTTGQVVQKLYESADDIDSLSCNLSSVYAGKLGAGRVNAFNAVNGLCPDDDLDDFGTCDGDCDDQNKNVYPGSPEFCNGIDDNCDGNIDEGFTTYNYFRDSDEDGYGDPTNSKVACAPPEGFVDNNTDCDDGNASINPGASEICNSLDDNCNGQVDEGFDNDGDGYTSCQGDCNDGEASINPEASEICNEIDDNCDGQIDEGLTCTDCGNGICELGEDCESCPDDCITGSNSGCGNGFCEPSIGEDCLSCPDDCAGKKGGKPSKRFCCGDGDGMNPVGCGDPRCTNGEFDCVSLLVPYCCGDGECDGAEDSNNCELDCGESSFCGDGSCDPGEDVCSCPGDCGSPPLIEENCVDGVDNDCDGSTDCGDLDCDSDPACDCGLKKSTCTVNSDCCSNRCFRGACK